MPGDGLEIDAAHERPRPNQVIRHGAGEIETVVGDEHRIEVAVDRAEQRGIVRLAVARVVAGLEMLVGDDARAKFVVTGNVPFLPPGMRKADVTPVGIAMTKDGKTAYLALGHAAHVAVVDVAARKVLGYILVGKRAWGITLSRDEKTLYVANGLGDDVSIIDTASRKAKVSVPVGRVPYGIAVDE